MPTDPDSSSSPEDTAAPRRTLPLWAAGLCAVFAGVLMNLSFPATDRAMESELVPGEEPEEADERSERGLRVSQEDAREEQRHRGDEARVRPALHPRDLPPARMEPGIRAHRREVGQDAQPEPYAAHRTSGNAEGR